MKTKISKVEKLTAGNSAAAAKEPEPKVHREATNVGGDEIVKGGDFLQVPRTFLYLGDYRPDLVGPKLKSRHLYLLLVLAAHKFKSKPIRVYWEALGGKMGVKAGTVRKWGYELREMGIIKIKQHRGRDSKTGQPGIRNERNSFDLSPIVDVVKQAHEHRKRDRVNHKRRRNGDEE